MTAILFSLFSRSPAFGKVWKMVADRLQNATKKRRIAPHIQVVFIYSGQNATAVLHI